MLWSWDWKMVAHWSAKLAQCQIGIERRNADPNDLTSSDFDGPEPLPTALKLLQPYVPSEFEFEQ